MCGQTQSVELRSVRLHGLTFGRRSFLKGTGILLFGSDVAMNDQLPVDGQTAAHRSC
jgi:hypothetical protein